MNTYILSVNYISDEHTRNLHETYFLGRNARYGMLFVMNDPKKALTIRVDLTEEEVTYLALLLDANIYLYNEAKLIVTFMQSIEEFIK